ncbi:hypothetical protein [Pseudonocardia sp. 73-21]|uniref:hypothetical protein n=1 Tax=Pseudonocardia sp. 73-21 TaxID=1895809 RepID=UPI0026123898|nr:hypothetical protein [Pseudonocardia sp. 73-21]
MRTMDTGAAEAAEASTALARLTSRLRPARELAEGATRYLNTLLIGVLLAPVAPDVAVDLFGATLPSWRNPLLRLLAVLAVFALCLSAYRWRLHAARRRARRRGYRLAGVESREVVVLPIGFRTRYDARGRRTGSMSVANWLLDAARPSVVIGVTNPQIPAQQVEQLRAELAVDGIAFETVCLSAVHDPEVAVRDAEEMLVGQLQLRGLAERSCYVDTTGGTVALSMAMLRVAALIGAQCTYVSSRFENNQPVPGTQVGHAFDPRTLLGVAT